MLKILLPLAFSVFSTSALSQTLLPPEELPRCPALTVESDRISVQPPLAEVNFVTKYSTVSSKHVAEITELSERIVTFFETGTIGDGAGYRSFSKVDGLSIGKLQWNWKAEQNGTLIREFFKGVPLASVKRVQDLQLQKHLFALWQLANGLGDSHSAEAAINFLSHQKPSSNFSEWLGSADITHVQDELIAERKRLALVLTETWMKDRGYADKHFERTFLVMNNFNTQAGLNPNQGGLRGVWVPQVEAFRSKFKSKYEMFDYILKWVRSCKNASAIGRVLHGVYMFEPKPGSSKPWARGNLDRWGGEDFIDSLDDVQIDLFAYSFMYSLMSISAYGGGGPGNLQLLVFNRGGSLALGEGVAHAAVYNEKNFGR